MKSYEVELPWWFSGTPTKGGGELPPDGPPWGIEPGDEEAPKDARKLRRSDKPLPGSPLPPPLPDGPPWGIEPGDEEDSKNASLFFSLKPFAPPLPDGPPWGIEPGDEEDSKKARKLRRAKNP